MTALPPRSRRAAGILRSWRRVIETLRHGTGGAGDGAELLAVAVDPTARGRGAGTLLVEGFLAEIGRRGQDAAHVVVAAGQRDCGRAVPASRVSHMVERFELHSGTESLLMQWSGSARHGVVTDGDPARRAGRSRRHGGGCSVVHRGRPPLGILDRPGALKTQESPVPYLGGVAVFAGVTVGVCGRTAHRAGPAGGRPGGRGRRRSVRAPAPLRLAAQLGVGAVIAATQPVHLPGWIGVPLVMVARRRADQRIQSARRSRHAGRRRRGGGRASASPVPIGPARLMAASLTGALVGFVWYNRPPARIYLGDGGSYLLGASMTVLLAYAWGIGISGANRRDRAGPAGRPGDRGCVRHRRAVAVAAARS